MKERLAPVSLTLEETFPKQLKFQVLSQPFRICSLRLSTNIGQPTLQVCQTSSIRGLHPSCKDQVLRNLN